MQKADMSICVRAFPFLPVISPGATCPPKNDNAALLMIHINHKEMIVLADNEDFGLDWA
jgi:hypothetical protein